MLKRCVILTVDAHIQCPFNVSILSTAEMCDVRPPSLDAVAQQLETLESAGRWNGHGNERDHL